MRNIIKNLSDTEFRELLLSSNSFLDIIRKLNLNPCGAQYDAIHRRIKLLGLDTSHFNRSRYTAKAVLSVKIPIQEILKQDSPYGSIHTLKRRLVSEGILTYSCSICGINQWNGQSISLQLDHINGVRNDHRIENLRFVCPNCHSQTDTYAGKNKRK